jgi:hypothetical protein
MIIKCLSSILLLYSLFATIVSAQQKAENHVEKDPVPRNAIEFILDAFDDYTIVALGEGQHTNLQAAIFRQQLISDPRFSRKVSNIIVECGTGRFQSIMDRYIAGKTVPFDSVRMCWQETTQPVIWDAPIYEEFFRAVRSLNKSLPPENQIRVLLGDPPIDWSRIKTREDLEYWYNNHMISRPHGKSNYRDGYAFKVLEREVISKGEKALAVFGDQHFAKPDIVMGEGFFGDYLKGNLFVQLEHSYPGSTLSISTHTGKKIIESSYPQILTWDKASIALLKDTKLGSIPWGPLKMEDLHDAILWVGPISSISYSNLGYETIKKESYYLEALRRDKLWMNQYQDALIKLREKYLREIGINTKGNLSTGPQSGR